MRTLGVTSPPAHPLPPGCHGPGSEHGLAKPSPSPTEMLRSQERVTCGVPSVLGWVLPPARSRVKRRVDWLAEGVLETSDALDGSWACCRDIPWVASRVAVSGGEKSAVSVNLGHGGHSGDDGDGGGAGSERREADQGPWPRTRLSWEGPPLLSPIQQDSCSVAMGTLAGIPQDTFLLLWTLLE